MGAPLKLRAGSSNTKSACRVNAVAVGASRTSILARRLAAVAPVSHSELTMPFNGELSMTGLSPSSSSTLRRFGITVSIFSDLWKVAPPTMAVASQLPVGASAVVFNSKA